jgi:hypothetical protein
MMRHLHRGSPQAREDLSIFSPSRPGTGVSRPPFRHGARAADRQRQRRSRRRARRGACTLSRSTPPRASNGARFSPVGMVDGRFPSLYNLRDQDGKSKRNAACFTSQ